MSLEASNPEAGRDADGFGRLRDLYERHGQSPWLDNLRRGWVTSGQLNEWVARGIRGLTSNPTIFQQAITASDDYDEQFSDCIGAGDEVVDAYWKLVRTDITGALAAFSDLHRQSGGADGFVSVEVDPALAHHTDATASAALDLHRGINAPNLMVKIPGTAAGLPAIEAVVAEGRSVNVTLIFAVERYEAVAEAYLRGLERFAGRQAADGGEAPLAQVASVASFFISRIDTEVDRRLEAVGTPEALALRGAVAIANARRAYVSYQQMFSGPRWERLEALGARPQRLLWASTSTKNPAYPPTLYVDELIGPDTVNTMPDATLEQFAAGQSLERTLDGPEAAEGAEQTLVALAAVGVNLAAVCEQLEAEGVAAFTKSFDELLATLGDKARQLG